jgi:hypothetical protein
MTDSRKPLERMTEETAIDMVHSIEYAFSLSLHVLRSSSWKQYKVYGIKLTL